MNEIDVSNNSLGDWQVSSQSHHNIASQRLRSYDLMALYKSVYCYCYYYNCEQRYFAFVPRNAMLASAVFAVVVCPSVRLSVCLSVRPFVTSRYCIETTGRIKLDFSTEASFHLPHIVL